MIAGRNSVMCQGCQKTAEKSFQWCVTFLHCHCTSFSSDLHHFEGVLPSQSLPDCFWRAISFQILLFWKEDNLPESVFRSWRDNCRIRFFLISEGFFRLRTNLFWNYCEKDCDQTVFSLKQFYRINCIIDLAPSSILRVWGFSYHMFLF